MPHSHHSHSGQFCRHAKDELEVIVKEAIRQGFTTYGLSEHAPRYRLEDLFPEEVSAVCGSRESHQQWLSVMSSTGEAIFNSALGNCRLAV
jgi:HisJ family histidinol phosphate phosphatase